MSRRDYDEGRSDQKFYDSLNDSNGSGCGCLILLVILVLVGYGISNVFSCVNSFVLGVFREHLVASRIIATSLAVIVLSGIPIIRTIRQSWNMRGQNYCASNPPYKLGFRDFTPLLFSAVLPILILISHYMVLQIQTVNNQAGNSYIGYIEANFIGYIFSVVAISKAHHTILIHNKISLHDGKIHFVNVLAYVFLFIGLSEIIFIIGYAIYGIFVIK